MSSATPYEQLEQEFRRLHAFRGALALLRWDAAVMMPRGSADVRGEQIAALESECHTLLIAPRLSRLLERAQANQQALEDWQQSNLREMQRLRDHAFATPVALIQRMARATTRAEAAWFEARRQRDFGLLAPQLDEVIKLVRDKAALLARHLNLDPYDALADEFTPGMLSTDFDKIFTALSRRLPELTIEVGELQAARPPLPIQGRFGGSKQRALCVEVMKALGFPFDRGRFDESEQALSEGVPGDMRVTARLDRADPFTGLLGALHETGQAMYDLGLPQAWRDQPVGKARGMALEESQSLLLEQIVGRSRPFVAYLRPLLEKHFGVSGPELEPDNLYRRLTTVRRSLVRVEADELTYPLHIMLRYELEQQLLSGELRTRDLPAAWNEQVQRRLRLTPADDLEGCLQDPHWAIGSFGYFPAYVLGSVVAAQLWEALREERPGLDEAIARGEFSSLMSWLRENVHALGAKVGVPELVQLATGKPLSASAFLRYVERKYTAGG